MMNTTNTLTGAEMGVGTWQWGDTMLWQYGQDYAATEVQGAFDASFAAGLTLFDTAEVYGMGRSEMLLGQFRRTTTQPLYLATKFFPMPWRFTRRQLRDALRHSLQRLGVAQVDLYQLHWPTPLTSIEMWMDALADAVEEGLTREVGVSNYNLEQTRRAAEALAKRGVRLASNQVEYSLLHRDIETNGVLNYCHTHDIRVIAYSPLAKGLLTGKYTPDHRPPGLRGAISREKLARLHSLLEEMRCIGAGHSVDGIAKTHAQVALNWCMCKGTLPIPGAKNAEQARANAGALGWRLTEAEINILDDVSRGV
jgi:aryl-alcohol dehydrogenase-like predicted oxidoreductase